MRQTYAFGVEDEKMKLIMIIGKCRIEKNVDDKVTVVGYLEPNATFGEVNFLLYGLATSSLVGDSEKVFKKNLLLTASIEESNPFQLHYPPHFFYTFLSFSKDFSHS